jgi:ribosomal protein S12 methylthiotransferase RimO
MSERTVGLVTLGCARNTVDSEELAGRLEEAGWTLVDDADDAAVTLVNTCGFVEAAKQESIDTVLAASDGGGPVVAVGCLAERYGAELAGALPEATVLGFDDYAEIGARLEDVLAGRAHVAHHPVDRRTRLPLTPIARPAATDGIGLPGHLGGPDVPRRRMETGPVAPVKLASGCDRRCSFCAIPSFRGAFVSRPPGDVLADVRWLASRGVREVVLVSENTTSYGKDLGDLRLLESLLPDLAAVPGIARVRLSYLQPAELRPSLVEAIATTPGVAAYFDLSFQHASGDVLRRMRRYGDGPRFLELLAHVRDLAPEAGVRSNVIVGFPGEGADDVAALHDFLVAAELDAVGVFGYSDEDGTEAATLDGKVAPEMIRGRIEDTTRIIEELTAQRAEARVGTTVDVVVEEVGPESAEGRAEHQGQDDGSTTLLGAQADGRDLAVGDVIRATVVDCVGVDLVARVVG